MLQGRRKVLALLAVLGVAFVAPGVPSAQNADAGAFLESLTQDVFAKLDDPSLGQTEKERDLRSLFRQNFDVPAISRFVLGKHWRRASAAERQDFADAFEEMNSRRFLAMVGEFSVQASPAVTGSNMGSELASSRVGANDEEGRRPRPRRAWAPPRVIETERRARPRPPQGRGRSPTGDTCYYLPLAHGSAPFLAVHTYS